MTTALHSLLAVTTQLALLAALFVTLERAFALRRERVLRAEFWNDVGYNLLNGMLLSMLLALPVAAMALAARHLVPDAVLRGAAELPMWARVPLVLVVGDIGAYWGHRLSHRWPRLWRFHLIHHSASHVDWLVNTRAHPVDLVFTRLCGLAPLFALGLAQTTAGANAMPAVLSGFMLVWSYVIHANVCWRFGWLEYLVATPAFHHWHHTNDELRDRNFAAIFPFVDMMFGTFVLPRHYPNVYGVDAPPSTSLAAQLLDPLLPDRQPSASAISPAKRSSMPSSAQ